MHKALLPTLVAATVLTVQTSCNSTQGHCPVYPDKNPVVLDDQSIDKEIAAARDKVDDLDTAVRMMKNGKADVCPYDPSMSLAEAEKELAAAQDELDGLLTARRMTRRGAAN